MPEHDRLTTRKPTPEELMVPAIVAEIADELLERDLVTFKRLNAIIDHQREQDAQAMEIAADGIDSEPDKAKRFLREIAAALRKMGEAK